MFFLCVFTDRRKISCVLFSRVMNSLDGTDFLSTESG